MNSVVGAQGLNIGVQDSFNLAWKLAAVITGSAAPALLDTYAAERRPAAKRIVAGTTRATRMTLLRRPPAVLARRHLAPLVLRRPRMRSAIEHALSQLDISYRGPGSAARDSVVAGDRAPDAPLRFSPARRRQPRPSPGSSTSSNTTNSHCCWSATTRSIRQVRSIEQAIVRLPDGPVVCGAARPKYEPQDVPPPTRQRSWSTRRHGAP